MSKTLEEEAEHLQAYLLMMGLRITGQGLEGVTVWEVLGGQPDKFMAMEFRPSDKTHGPFMMRWRVKDESYARARSYSTAREAIAAFSAKWDEFHELE
jgi:hypothetical protein